MIRSPPGKIAPPTRCCTATQAGKGTASSDRMAAARAMKSCSRCVNTRCRAWAIRKDSPCVAEEGMPRTCMALGCAGAMRGAEALTATAAEALTTGAATVAMVQGGWVSVRRKVWRRCP